MYIRSLLTWRTLRIVTVTVLGTGQSQSLTQVYNVFNVQARV